MKRQQLLCLWGYARDAIAILFYRVGKMGITVHLDAYQQRIALDYGEVYMEEWLYPTKGTSNNV